MDRVKFKGFGLFRTFAGILVSQSFLVLALASGGTVPRGAVARDWGRELPILFEENRGQVPADVKYLTRGVDYSLFFTAGRVVWTLHGSPGAVQMVGFEIQGMSQDSRLIAERVVRSKTAYLVGSDPSRWSSDIPNYERVRYRNVYPGIDLLFYGTRGRLEYDFVVAPGADPNQIRWKFQGVESIEVNPEGQLVLETTIGELRHLAPRLHQRAKGQTEEISGRYRLLEDGIVGFEVNAYDRDSVLTIDPVLVYSTYLGGSKAEVPGGVSVDSEGNVYIVGNTGSLDFPTRNPYQEQFAGGGSPNGDVFVSKIDSSGSFVVYSTYVGGTGTDVAGGVAVDSQGRAVVTGTTFSGDFPSTPGSFQTSCGGQCPFVVRLSPNGSELSYGTFLGAGNGTAIDVDGLDQAVMTGRTTDPDFPVSHAFQPERGGGADAFVSKLNAAGTALVFSTYLGGSGDDNLTGKQGVAVDPSGNVYVTGRTRSSDFPLKNAVQAAYGGENDAFVTKLSPQGELVYSTYLGGTLGDEGQGIDADASGNAYIAGNTKSLDFPIENAFQPVYGGGTAVGDAFVAKLPPAGGSLVYSTYLGGQLGDTANDIAVDDLGRPVVVGNGASNFPVLGPIRDFDGTDNYVAKFEQDGSGLFYSTPIGGGDADVFVTTFGTEVFVSGNISSGNYPVLNAFQPRSAGSTEVFLSRISDAGTLYFAQFANGVGAVSEILLTGSSTASPSSATVTFRGDDGEFLPVNVSVLNDDGSTVDHRQVSQLDVEVQPLGLVKITSDGAGTPTPGSVSVNYNSPLGGLIRFTLSPFGTAGVGASELVRGFVTPVRKTAINTGVAIYNPEPESVGLTLRLRDLAGEEIPGGLKVTALEAHGHLSVFIDQLFPNADLKDFEGTITVETNSLNALITATALELGSLPGEFTTLPVTPVP